MEKNKRYNNLAIYKSKFKAQQPPMREAVFGMKLDYIPSRPSRLTTPPTKASTAPIFLNISVLSADTKAANPYHRKNRAIHQAPIVANILHSPLAKRSIGRIANLTKITPVQISSCARNNLLF